MNDDTAALSRQINLLSMVLLAAVITIVGFGIWILVLIHFEDKLMEQVKWCDGRNGVLIVHPDGERTCKQGEPAARAEAKS
jgi:hypothetical protein